MLMAMMMEGKSGECSESKGTKIICCCTKNIILAVHFYESREGTQISFIPAVA